MRTREERRRERREEREKDITPYSDEEFRDTSLDPGSVKERRRFESNLAKHKVITADNIGEYLAKVRPVGSIYLSYESTNPAEVFGYGVWAKIAEGRFIVGQSESDAAFSSPGAIGGAKTAAIAAHTHDVDVGSFTSGAGSSHDHSFSDTSGGPSATVNRPTGTETPDIPFVTATHTHDVGGTTGNESSHTHSINPPSATSTESTATDLSIVPPYFVVYAWRRTA